MYVEIAQAIWQLTKPIANAVLRLLACAFFLGSTAQAEPLPALDYQIKAAMLYKFLGYIDWPETAFAAAESPYRVWVLGGPNMGAELKTIVAGRSVNGRPVEIYAANRVEELIAPHVVFIGRDADKQLGKVAQRAHQNSFLIVTENDQGIEAGSVINLRLVEGRVGFDVSLVGAQACNLKLSARLLSVASSVEEPPQ